MKWFLFVAVLMAICSAGCGSSNATYGKDTRDWDAPLMDQAWLDEDKAIERSHRNATHPPKDFIDRMTR